MFSGASCWRPGKEELLCGGELDSFVETMTLDESRDYVKRVLVLADSDRQLYALAS